MSRRLAGVLDITRRSLRGWCARRQRRRRWWGDISRGVRGKVLAAVSECDGWRDGLGVCSNKMFEAEQGAHHQASVELVMVAAVKQHAKGAHAGVRPVH